MQLTWDADTDLTYEVSRAEAVWPQGTIDYTLMNAVSLGAFSTPVVVPAASYVQGKAVYIDTGLTVRKSYLYKVVPIQKGVKGNPAYKGLNEGAYSTLSYLSTEQSTTYYGVGITISDPSSNPKSYWADNPVIKVYRRQSGNPQTPYVYLTGKDITASAFTTATKDGGSYVFVDDPATLTLGNRYQYKFVVTLGTTEFENKPASGNESNETTATAQSVPSISWVNVTSPLNTTIKGTLVLSFPYLYTGYKRAPITVEYRVGTDSWTTKTGNLNDEGTYSLTGLTSSTAYNIRVQQTSDPDDGYASASGSYTPY
ncbi:MAG: hypothetical protein LBG24_06130 [Treponema sp.]|nr:hypothetical protein [Treponema sp.]